MGTLVHQCNSKKNANLSQSGNGKSIVCFFTDFVLTARICQEDII